MCDLLGFITGVCTLGALGNILVDGICGFECISVTCTISLAQTSCRFVVDGSWVHGGRVQVAFHHLNIATLTVPEPYANGYYSQTLNRRYQDGIIESFECIIDGRKGTCSCGSLVQTVRCGGESDLITTIQVAVSDPKQTEYYSQNTLKKSTRRADQGGEEATRRCQESLFLITTNEDSVTIESPLCVLLSPPFATTSGLPLPVRYRIYQRNYYHPLRIRPNAFR
jgi:hypothetical protein